MKNKMLTIALLLSTGIALPAEDGGIVGFTTYEKPVRPESPYDVFVIKLERVGQEKLLDALQRRFDVLSLDIKKIADSRNKIKASATEIEAFQEKLTEQHDYSGLISTLKKKLTPQEYSNFLRENSQLIFHLLVGNNERITPPGYHEPIGLPIDQREHEELLSKVNEILQIVTELKNRR